jgi:hypothetical protein
MARRVPEATHSRGLVGALAVFSLFVSVTGAFLLVPGVNVGGVAAQAPIQELLGFDDPSASAAENPRRARGATRSLGKERVQAIVQRRRAAGLGTRGGELALPAGVEASTVSLGAWIVSSSGDTWAAGTTNTAPRADSETGSGNAGGGGGTSPLGGGTTDSGGPREDDTRPPDDDGGPGKGQDNRGDEDDDEEADEAAEAREKAEEARERAEDAAEEAREKAEEAAERAEEAAEEAEEP